MNFARFLLQESKYLYNTDVKSVLIWVYNIFEKAEEESKRPRDPRPLLKDNDSMGLPYGYTSLHVALLSKDRHVITCPTHCRDYINEAIRWHVCGDSKAVFSSHCNEDFEGDIDMRSLRLVLFLDEPRYFSSDVPIFDGIKNGIRVANMYGRVAGWKPIRLVRARVPNGEEDYRECYVLIGDRNWQRTPQYISMLVLLIRICLMWEVPEWIDDAYALTGYWHEFIYNTEDRPDNSDITVFLTNSYHHMLLMVAHDREIFPGNMLSAYSSRHNSFHGSSGINALVCDDSVHPKAAEKLKHYYNTEVLLNDRSG